MLINFREGTNFYQFRILLQQPGWYLPHALHWHCLCCLIMLLWFYQLQALYVRLILLRSDRARVKGVGGNPIPRWGFPAWDCIMHIEHLPIFFVLLHQGACSHIFLDSFSGWFCVLFEFFMCISLPLFLHIHCRWFGQGLFGVSAYCIFVSPSSSPVFPRCANISLFLTPLDWYFLLEL